MRSSRHMKICYSRIVLVVLVVCLAVPLVAAEPAATPDIVPGERLAGDLEELDGRVVVLHFWASWCIPCRAEMVELAEFRLDGYTAMAEQGLRLITISNDVRDIDLQRFAEQVELVFPLYYDPLSKLSARYNVRGLPATLVLDADGTVLDQMLGTQQWSSPVFRGRLWTYLRQGEISN